MVKVLVGNMANHEPWWAEWWSAIAALFWCATTVYMGGLKVFPGFSPLLQVAPQWFWYMFGFAAPIGQIWALRSDRRNTRFWLCFAMAWWWSFVWFAVAANGIQVPSLIFYGVFALINLNSILRLRPKWTR